MSLLNLKLTNILLCRSVARHLMTNILVKLIIQLFYYKKNIYYLFFLLWEYYHWLITMPVWTIYKNESVPISAHRLSDSGSGTFYTINNI